MKTRTLSAFGFVLALVASLAVVLPPFGASSTAQTTEAPPPEGAPLPADEVLPNSVTIDVSRPERALYRIAVPNLSGDAEMGGTGAESQETRATEASVRGFWKAWRGYMGV